MPNENHEPLGADDISDIIRMQQREDAGKQQKSQQPRGINLKARTFARPVKPIFEGKSVSEIMPRRNSDSTTNSEKLAELDADEISLSSVQNLPTIPSVAESPGLFSMLANFSRFSAPSKTNTQKTNDDSHRIGELPNKAKLQQQVESNVHMVDLKQNSGSLASSEKEGSNSSARLSLRLQRGSSYTTRSNSSGGGGGGRTTFQTLDDGENETPKNTLGDDDFFAALDGGDHRITHMPKVLEENEATTLEDNVVSRSSSQTTKERRAQRAHIKSTSYEPKTQELKRSLSDNDAGTSSPSSELIQSKKGRQTQPVNLENATKSDWTPIIPIGTKVQRHTRTSTIDESEHSISSIVAKRRPLAKETLLAQELARKQQEELAALMAQSMETLELEEMDESVDSQNEYETPTSHDWQDVIGDAYAKKASRPLALSVDEEGESTDDDDDILFRPKSREVQKIEEDVQKQKDQIRSVVKATPDVYEALQDTEILTNQEHKDMKQVHPDWHDVSGAATKTHAKSLSKGRNFYEDKDLEEELIVSPVSRETRQLEHATRKQRRQVQTTIEKTPDAQSAIKVTKVLSKKEKKAARRIKGEWHDVETDATKPPSSRINATGRHSINDENDDQEGSRPKSKMARSLKENSRRQQGLVEDLIIDSPDAVDALDMTQLDDREKFQDSLDTKKRWDSTNSDIIRSRTMTVDNDRDLYPEKDKGCPKAQQNLTETVEKCKTIEISPSARSSEPTIHASISNTLSRSKEITPTNAYPVSDRLVTGDEDILQNDPILLLKKKRPEYNTNQKIEDPDELEPLNLQRQGEWNGLDPAQYPFGSRGNYKQSEIKSNKDSGIGGPTKQSLSTNLIVVSSSNTNDEVKNQVNSTDHAYPVSDTPIRGDDDVSKDPILLLKKPVSNIDMNQMIRDPGDLIPLDIQNKTEWHAVDAGHHPLNRRNEMKSEKCSNSNPIQGESESQKCGLKLKSQKKASARKTPYKPFEESNKAETGPTGKRKKSHRSQGEDRKQENVEWLRVPSQHVKNLSKKSNSGFKTGKSGALIEKRVSCEQEESLSLSQDIDTSVKNDETCSENSSIKIVQEPSTTLNELENIGPFCKRPEINPFNHRPMDESLLSPSRSRKDKVGSANEQAEFDTTPSEQESIPSPACTKVDERPEEDPADSGNAARRTLLRKKVDDRREVLASMFHHTQEITLSTESEILDLKRKLALSQALVQRLEIENRALERKALLDFSEAQIQLLKQRDKRERELEKIIKSLMDERDSAVLECHDLRILISGSCEVCRQRFDYQKEYTMDYSIRNTILSKRKASNSSAFEWITAGLADEAESVNGEGDTDVAKSPIGESDIFFMETTQPDAHIMQNAPSFQFVPLQWLSTKLTSKSGVSNNVKDVKSDDRPDVIICNPEASPNEQLAGTDSSPTMINNDFSPEQSIYLSQREESKAQNGTPTKESSGLETPGEANMTNGCEMISPVLKETTDSTNYVTNTSLSETIGSSPIADSHLGEPPRSFLDGLLSEKVSADIPVPASQKDGTNFPARDRQMKKSFFSSLFGEKVDDNLEFAGIQSSRGSSSKYEDPYSSSPNPRKFGMGLKGERVLDDMEILNSIMSIPSDKQEHSAERQRIEKDKNGDKRRFGLTNEQFNEDDYDQKLLGALGQLTGAPDFVSRGTELKRSGIFALRSEKFDDDNRDARLLNVVKEGTTKETSFDSPVPVRPKQSLRSQSSSSPMTTIASPFSAPESSPRKRVLTNKGRRGAAFSGSSYLGRLSSKAMQAREKDLSSSPLPLPLSQSPNKAALDLTQLSPEISSTRFSALNDSSIEIDLDSERPWRNDAGKPPSIVDERNEEKERNNSKGPHNTGAEDEDLDQILALLAIEGS